MNPDKVKNTFNLKKWIEEYIIGTKKIKVQKMREKLAVEQELVERRQSELNCILVGKDERNKMLQEISRQQVELENKMKCLHLEKSADRSQLLLCLREAEKLSDSVIKELLSRNSSVLTVEQKLCQAEGDRILQEKLLKSHSERTEIHRKEAIFEAMCDSLASDSKLKKIFCDHQTAIINLQKKSLESKNNQSENLRKQLEIQDSERKELIKSIGEDEQLQRSAVSALLEQSDIQSFKLVHEIQNVEKQLAQATQLELKERQLNALENIYDLCEKRAALSQLLEKLLKQRDDRRNELLGMMELLQNQRWVQTNLDCGPDYWLGQYQNLLEMLPGNLLKAQQTLDARLVHYLVEVDAIHCLPFLAHCFNRGTNLQEISDQHLKNVGLTQSSDRSKVLEAVRSFVNEVKTPIVPVLDANLENDATPSAPQMNECIICFENEISVVFVDCGHCCCCDTCAVPLNVCPLCRTAVHKKTKLHFV